jgi:hypothetical protein
MAGRPVVLSPVYNALTGNVSMSNLDTTFSQVSAAFNEFLNCSVLAIDTGVANALAVNTAPATATIGLGLTLDVLVSNTNSGPTTLNVNAQGVLPVTDGQGNPLAANTLIGNTVYRMIYDGTQFRASGTASGGGVGPGSFTTLTASGQASLAATQIITGSGTALMVDSTIGGSGSTPTIKAYATGGSYGGIAFGGGAGPFTPGVNTFDIGQSSAGNALIIQRNNVDMDFYTNNTLRFVLQAAGTILVNQPDSGVAMTIVGAPANNVLGLNATSTTSAPLKVFLSSAGARVLETSTGPNFGGGGVTLTNNKPGGGNGTVFHWITVSIGGTTGYIPVFTA